MSEGTTKERELEEFEVAIPCRVWHKGQEVFRSDVELFVLVKAKAEIPEGAQADVNLFLQTLFDEWKKNNP